MKKDKYRLLVENMPDAFAYHKVLTDRGINPLDYIFLDVNPAFEEMTGLEKDKIIGRKVTEVLPGIQQSSFDWIGTYGKVALTGEGTRFERYSDTLDRWYEVTAYSDEPGYFVTIFRDVTMNKQAEAVIKASLMEKETLLKELHHRVKNNMQLICSLLALQISRSRDKHVKQALSDCQGRVKAMVSVHEMLHISDRLSVIDCQAYFSKLAGNVMQSHHKSPHQVKLKVDAQGVTLGISQASTLGLIINELLSNALKYGFSENRHGEIAIRLKEYDGGALQFVFSDNGTGIPEDLDWRHTKSLGLNLVVLLAENQLQGAINLVRATGSCFTIRFRRDVICDNLHQ